MASRAARLTGVKHSAVWKSGSLGFVGGLTLGAAGVVVASRRSAGFRSLSVPFRAFLACSSATFFGVTSADRASREVAKRRHADADFHSSSELEEQRYKGLHQATLWERTKTFVSEQRYPIVYGSWVASMGASFALVSRNRYLSRQQKLVQARVYAQGLTLLVLAASFALEGNDLRTGKGRWETVKVLDPAGSGQLVEKRIHHEAYSGEDQWLDMIESQEEKMRRAGHRVSSKDGVAEAEKQAKARGEKVHKSKAAKKLEQQHKDEAKEHEESAPAA